MYHRRGFSRERGIRTPGPLTVNGFQDRRIRPLCHLSKGLCWSLNSDAKIHFFLFLANFICYILELNKHTLQKLISNQSVIFYFIFKNPLIFYGTFTNTIKITKFTNFSIFSFCKWYFFI